VPSLLAIPHGPTSVYFAAGVVVALLVEWLLLRLGRRRYLVLGQSEATQLAIVHIGRIADSIDRLASAMESRNRTEGDHTGNVGMPTFGG
jgi:hypothetical protein